MYRKMLIEGWTIMRITRQNIIIYKTTIIINIIMKISKCISPSTDQKLNLKQKNAHH
jgi:hypothetical protein